jgi:hypothetical protein
MKSPITFGIVGGGWRADFFARIAQALPDRFRVTGCYSRTAATREKMAADWQIPACASLDALLQTQPGFVVLSVARKVCADFILELAARGIPVLAETPPADQLADLIHLWENLPEKAVVEIAEQYPFQPLTLARLAFIASGKLGTVTQAQVSAAHDYHGVVLIRKYLGIGFESPRIEAYAFTSPLTAGRNRQAGPTEEKIIASRQVIARLQFGDKLGVYDFTGDQYFSWVRSQRLLVRGEKGEINNLDASYLADFQTPIHLRFERRDAGHHGNLEGYCHQGYLAGESWLYRNPFRPARLADDEIAVASCLEAMQHCVETGQSFYGLAEASQDHYLGLLIGQAAQTGESLQATPQPWHPR